MVEEEKETADFNADRVQVITCDQEKGT